MVCAVSALVFLHFSKFFIFLKKHCFDSKIQPYGLIFSPHVEKKNLTYYVACKTCFVASNQEKNEYLYIFFFTTLMLCLSTLKLWFYFSTSTHSSSLPWADFQKCILYKKNCRANIFHMPPREAM